MLLLFLQILQTKQKWVLLGRAIAKCFLLPSPSSFPRVRKISFNILTIFPANSKCATKANSLPSFFYKLYHVARISSCLSHLPWKLTELFIPFTCLWQVAPQRSCSSQPGSALISIGSSLPIYSNYAPNVYRTASILKIAHRPNIPGSRFSSPAPGRTHGSLTALNTTRSTFAGLLWRQKHVHVTLQGH